MEFRLRIFPRAFFVINEANGPYQTSSRDLCERVFRENHDDSRVNPLFEPQFPP